MLGKNFHMVAKGWTLFLVRGWILFLVRGWILVLVRGWTDTIPSEGMDTIEKFIFWLRVRGRVGGLG